MADESKPYVKQYVKKPKYPTVGDLYPPNNSKDFLQSKADAKLEDSWRKFLGRRIRGNGQRPSKNDSLITKY